MTGFTDLWLPWRGNMMHDDWPPQATNRWDWIVFVLTTSAVGFLFCLVITKL